ncbi:hypothetical protein ST37_04060 [Vibrio sp. qd031]|uniref:capsule assembly Wzi family protein n=1 Tax=Vibrio sp. qd031 TaxID=1603038 RepID=UPI000A11E4A3|nr:capsule assembly Wzi family protein [Vibrio sp. qd031]ORT51868.1 hypothetical protein ST37_04060 [Vibrio sp. qd031]
MKRHLAYLLIILSLISQQAFGSLWINPDDAQLRSDIQMLAAAKVIRVPVTTYPLMWQGVKGDLDKYGHLANTPLLEGALARVNAAHITSQSAQGTVEIGGATDAKRFNHFGSPVREQGELTVGYQDSSTRWAYNLEATYSVNAHHDETFRLDNSYLAGVLGNWVFSAGYQAQWFGPGFDSALIMSTNARPLPGLHITRHNPEAFSVPILEWLGPWTLTTGLSWMDDERYMEDALLWTFRGTFRPHPNLELGVSRGAQMCGTHPDGNEKSCDLETFWRVLVGDTNVWSGENPANQIASMDAKWTSTVNSLPYSLYIEVAGEDNFNLNFPPFDKRSYLYGADITTPLKHGSLTTIFEITDTQSHCNYTNSYNCTYEHEPYRSGYRYNRRSLGSTYDNDTQTVTLGFLGINQASGHQWKANARYLMLNQDDSNKAPPGGSTVADKGENAINLDASYLFPIQIGQLELGAEVIFSEYLDGSESDYNLTAWGQWTYNF